MERLGEGISLMLDVATLGSHCLGPSVMAVWQNEMRTANLFLQEIRVLLSLAVFMRQDPSFIVQPVSTKCAFA